MGVSQSEIFCFVGSQVSVDNTLREANLSYWIYADHGTLGNKNKLKLCLNIYFL